MVRSIDFYNRFGFPDVNYQRKEMTVFTVPEWIRKSLPMVPERIFCNKQMLLPLTIAFYNIIDRGLLDEFKTWNGCFVVRPIRGYEEEYEQAIENGDIAIAMDLLSTHSWGCAIDVNKKENPLGHKPKMTPEFAQCFIDAGFDWGGNWKRPDGMHLQLSYLT